MNTVFRRYLAIDFILILIGVGVAVFYFAQPKLTSTTPSSEILSLTNPLYTLSGQVESIGKDFLILKKITAQNTSTTTAAGVVTVNPTQITAQESKYQVDITKTTTIKEFLSATPNLAISSPTTPITGVAAVPEKAIPLTDIKPGQFVQINTEQDLRTMRNDRFEATIITIYSIRQVEGTIENLQSGTITLKGKVSGSVPISAEIPLANLFPEKEYQIVTTAQTQIYTTKAKEKYAVNEDPTEKTKVTLSTLKKGDVITVYTQEDVLGNTRLTAIVIEDKTDLRPIQAVAVDDTTVTNIF